LELNRTKNYKQMVGEIDINFDFTQRMYYASGIHKTYLKGFRTKIKISFTTTPVEVSGVSEYKNIQEDRTIATIIKIEYDGKNFILINPNERGL